MYIFNVKSYISISKQENTPRQPEKQIVFRPRLNKAIYGVILREGVEVDCFAEILEYTARHPRHILFYIFATRNFFGFFTTE